MSFLGLDSARGGPLLHQLQAAGRKRLCLFDTTDAVRLVDPVGDGIPGLLIECFGEWAVLNVESQDWLARRAELAQVMAALGAEGSYLKIRARADLRRLDQLELAPPEPIVGRAAPVPLEVREGRCRYWVQLGDGLSTGLFLDQRSNRQAVEELSRGKRVLNLFCYTCSFSVAAAVGGASEVTSVDLSGAVLRRGASNLELNGVSSDSHRLLRADAAQWLARAVRRGERYDLIVLDPPSFSSRGKGSFSVSRDYEKLVADAVRLLSAGGKLLAVTNYRKWSFRQFERCLRSACVASGRSGVTLEPGTLPLDCAPRAGQEPLTKSCWLSTDDA